MDKKELMIIAELMDKLTDEMEMGEEDFAERLGRKKPDVEVVEIKGVKPEMDMEDPMEAMHEEEESPMHEMMESEDEDMDEDSSLKKRLMKIRGE